MKKIVPFNKEIIFKTNLEEITSISLEHTLSINDKILEGNFIVSGDYKINETSNIDPFSYELPFKIVFDSKYKLEGSTIDIEDFYYEIINNNVLKVSIEVSVDGIEEILVSNRCVEEEVVEIKQDTTNFNNDIKDTNDYSTYKVYIVRENDNLDTILSRYEVKKELLEEYNDLENLKIGDKIIIPIDYERD